ncbi:MAG: response regulator [Bacteroidota bacterium]
MYDQSEVDILLIEDNPHDAELATMSIRLVREDLKIVRCMDGEEAIEYIDNINGHLPKLILLDIKLPKVDGLEVLGKVKDFMRIKKIPVVIFTSSQLPADINLGKKLGADEYIVKPMQLPDFRREIRHVVEKYFGHPN